MLLHSINIGTVLVRNEIQLTFKKSNIRCQKDVIMFNKTKHDIYSVTVVFLMPLPKNLQTDDTRSHVQYLDYIIIIIVITTICPEVG